MVAHITIETKGATQTATTATGAAGLNGDTISSHYPIHFNRQFNFYSVLKTQLMSDGHTSENPKMNNRIFKWNKTNAAERRTTEKNLKRKNKNDEFSHSIEFFEMNWNVNVQALFITLTQKTIHDCIELTIIWLIDNHNMICSIGYSHVHDLKFIIKCVKTEKHTLREPDTNLCYNTVTLATIFFSITSLLERNPSLHLFKMLVVIIYEFNFGCKEKLLVLSEFLPTLRTMVESGIITATLSYLKRWVVQLKLW